MKPGLKRHLDNDQQAGLSFAFPVIKATANLPLPNGHTRGACKTVQVTNLILKMVQIHSEGLGRHNRRMWEDVSLFRDCGNPASNLGVRENRGSYLIKPLYSLEEWSIPQG